ncbi:MAG: DUF4097 family beta strand repeat-containing protein [Acetobacteraceae bacterium]
MRTRSSRVALGLVLLVVPALGYAHGVEAQARQQARQRSGGNAAAALNRVDSTFAFDKSGSIAVTARSGDIVITGWNRDQVRLRATGDSDDADSTGDIRLDASSSRLTVESTGRRGGDTRFELSVPYGVRVVATSRSGDVSVRGTRGQVEIHSQNGDVDVDDVATRLDVRTFSGDLTATNIMGDVEISTLNGGVRITDLRGNVDVGTISGDIELRGVQSKLVRAHTTSGDVTYDGVIDPAGRYELSAHSGDLRLHVPRNASAQLTVSTWNGGIDSEFPITLTPGEHGIGLTTSKRLTFQIGGGAARITAETFSGDITISSNGRGPADRR